MDLVVRAGGSRRDRWPCTRR